jgi:energy-coupling factor transport system ATP-binding protein
MITIRQLVHKYGTGDVQVEALEGIDLNIQAGEFVVIIGPNGSGKSTLAKHLNALLLPTSGEVLIRGMDTRDTGRLWDIRRTAGMVFQNPDNQLVATMVEEDVAFGPENLGMPPEVIRQRVAQALTAVDMAGYERHAPHLLSGGQKQRVAIAGILAMQPAVIILDEPTAMLDPSGRAEVLRTVHKLNAEEGITVIHITHFMDEAVHADRVVVMNEGHIVFQGTPREVFARVDELKDCGLDIPPVTELAHELRLRGVELSADTLTVDELVAQLCP